MKRIEDYAKKGEHRDEMKALRLLTEAYIDMCGISLGFRTVVYCAAEAWVERLAWLDLPLSEMARKEPLVCLMPHITDLYKPEIYDRYDIAGMGDPELLAACRRIIVEKTFDEATTEVLCWGILKATEEKEELSQEVEATAADGTLLKGVLTEQSCPRTWVKMTSPFNGILIWKSELVRKPGELLLQGYEDCRCLQGREQEIRALYSEYQEALRQQRNSSMWKKDRVFDEIFATVVGDTTLAYPQKLFREWFGMEFFDTFTCKDPSWLR